MAPKTKQPPIGDSKKDRFKSGETWRVVWVTDRIDLGLKKDDRLRIEEKFGPKKASLFPEKGTGLYAKGFKEITLEEVKDDPAEGYTFVFQGLLQGEKTTLWLQEGGAADAEAEIWTIDPASVGGGGNGGVVGIRR
jgi:hypothetical protein